MWTPLLTAVCLSLCAGEEDELLIVKGGSAIVGGMIQLDCWSKVAQDTMSVLVWKKEPSQSLFFKNQTAMTDPRFKLVSWQPHRSIISIQRLKAEDHGIYTCTDYGRKLPLARSASVNVWVPPSQPVVSGPDKPIEENELMELVCTSQQGRPAATIYWKKDERKLPNDTTHVDVNGTISSSIRILVNRRDDGRQATCVVNHITGVLWTNWTLLVEYPPEVEISKTYGSSSEGEEQKYECRAKGRPRPSPPQWLRGEKCLSTSNFSTLSHFLVLSNLSMSDTGLYVCVSRNRLGETRTTLNVSVSEPPSVVGTTLEVSTHSYIWPLVAGAIIIFLILVIVISLATNHYLKTRKGNYNTNEGTYESQEEKTEILINNGDTDTTHTNREPYV
uniref:cell adhesion molecule 3-like isoform X1 n=2 Tax=Myxine glutinosa TaxID=7769 RepID=UPI00358F1BF4